MRILKLIIDTKKNLLSFGKKLKWEVNISLLRYQNMKLGIIGSTGFIGNNLYFYLSKFKNYKVFRYSSYKKNNKY